MQALLTSRSYIKAMDELEPSPRLSGLPAQLLGHKGLRCDPLAVGRPPSSWQRELPLCLQTEPQTPFRLRVPGAPSPLCMEGLRDKSASFCLEWYH